MEVGDAHSVRSGQPQLAGSYSSPLCGAGPLKPLWWGPAVQVLPGFAWQCMRSWCCCGCGGRGEWPDVAVVGPGKGPAENERLGEPQLRTGGNRDLSGRRGWLIRSTRRAARGQRVVSPLLVRAAGGGYVTPTPLIPRLASACPNLD